MRLIFVLLLSCGLIQASPLFACAVDLTRSRGAAGTSVHSGIESELLYSFISSWLLLRGEDPIEVWRELERRYSEPGRAYHTLRHIHEGHALLLEFFRAHPMRPTDQAMLIIAWWFHDSIYHTEWSNPAVDNEGESAKLFFLRARTIPLGYKVPIRELIKVTKKHTGLGELAKVIVETDLSILGMAPVRFAEYERGIRHEYAWVQDEVYRMNRSQIMNGFAKRDPIFHIPFFNERFETQAHINLEPYLYIPGTQSKW